MKYRIPSLSETILSIVSGAFITVTAFLLFLYLTPRNSETPLVEANRYAWILFWPDLIWRRLLPDSYEIASLVTTIFTFAVLTYFLFRLATRWRGR
jgi:hypothetical protein